MASQDTVKLKIGHKLYEIESSKLTLAGIFIEPVKEKAPQRRMTQLFKNYQRTNLQKQLVTKSEDIVKLNIGGTVFETTRSTLTGYDGYFRAMFESGIQLKLDESGCIFIDRSPKHFDKILNFLRDGDVPLSEFRFETEQLLKEAQYYLLDDLIHLTGGETSEEWKKENLNLYMKDWRGANLRGEIQYTEDDKELLDFRSYCIRKHSLLIHYNVKNWGEILENRHVRNFVKNYSGTWNILFFDFHDRAPKFFIKLPDDIIICCVGKKQWTCEEFFERVEIKMIECASNKC